MRKKIMVTSFLLMAVAATSSMAAAQSGPVIEHRVIQPELALTYLYIHSNAPPGGCGGFSLHGGGASLAWPIGTGRFALVGEVAAATTPHISNAQTGLTLSTYTKMAPSVIGDSSRSASSDISGSNSVEGIEVNGVSDSYQGVSGVGATNAGVAGESTHFNVIALAARLC